MRDHSPRLRPYLRRYAASDADARDLLQEVWLRAFAKRRTFAGRGSFFGWLLTVSRTVGMAAVSRRGRELATEPLHDAAHSVEPDAHLLRMPAPTHDADVHLLRDSLREAVLALPERQRDVVLLRLVEGRSTAETAQLLGCAEGTVKATLHRATSKLQDLLKEKV